MKHIAELLAPAGNMEALKAAVQGGCDAVYLGLSQYSARAFAGNFTHDEFREAIAYCHLRNVKIYVTINTMLYETEIENVKKELDFLYENDADAILVQDFGLFHLIRTCYPDLDVHCSTQMHIHNEAGVRLMKEQGAARVVLARETPLEIVKQCCDTGMDIEVFVYGAICISYSGQCLMSASLKNRSANRGMCAQPCRLRYYPNEKDHFAEGDYALSPKDLNVIDRLPELLEAGVSSLKIEGRMKRPEYVYLVTKTFREALDAYAAGKPYTVSRQRHEELLLMFNRGFSKGHLFHAADKERMSHFRPNHQGIQIGEVLGYEKGRVKVKLSHPLYQHDGLRILAKTEDIGLTAVRIERDGKLVNKADKGDVVILSCTCQYPPKKGAPLQKTSDTLLLDQLAADVKAEKRTVPVTLSFAAEPGLPLRVTVRDDRGNVAKAQSEVELMVPQKAPVSQERIVQAMARTSEFPFAVTVETESYAPVFAPVSVLNSTRRAALEKLAELRIHTHVRKGVLPYDVSLPEKTVNLPHLLAEGWSGNEQDIMALTEGVNLCPTLNETLKEKKDLKNCVLASAGDLYMNLSHCIAGMTFNVANSYALCWLLHFDGVDGVVFSSEMNNLQIRMALEAFEKRYGFVPFTYRLVYGRRVLMHIKNGIGLPEKNEILTDKHGNLFRLSYNDNILSITESDIYRAENPYCKGSLVILGKNEKDAESVMEEAHEEVFRRI